MHTQRNAQRLAGYLFVSILVSACGGGGGDNSMAPPPPMSGTSPNDAVAVTSANRVLSFSRSSPQTTTAMAITGLQTAESVIGLDTRPADGMLYALTNQGRIYLLNAATGAASLRSTLTADPTDMSAPYNGLNGASYGVNFNPVVDRLRVVSNTGQNLRINVDLGTVITDAPLTSQGSTRMGVTLVSYTSAFSSACRTIVSLIDTQLDRVLTSVNLTGGVLTDVGALGVDASSVSAFDIVTGSDGTDTAVALLQVGGTTSFYTINLQSGSVSGTPVALGGLNAGESVTGLAIAAPTSQPSQAIGNMLGLTESNRLISFNTNAPRKLCTSTQITGLQSAERLLGIDTRPSDGQLYALGSSGSIYTINTSTGAANARSTLSPDPNDTTNPFTGLSGVEFSFEFNPIADQVRVLSDNGQNLRINVDNGATATDTSLNPAGFTVTAIAYTNGFAGAGSITAYVLDSQGDQLLGLGIGSGSAVNGDLSVIGSLGIGDIGSISSLEINGVTNMAFAATNIGQATTSELDSINLMTGQAMRVDTIGGSERVRGLAVTNVPQATVVAATADNMLVSFKPLMPSTFTNSVPITGLQGSESLIGLDYRPANGLLYGLTDAGRVYTLNSSTGAATAISTFAADPTDNTAPYTAFMGTAFGFDFNPVADAIRTFSDAEENLRSNADTGRTFTDGTLNRGPFNVTSAAYTNSFAPPSTTTLYVMDTTNDVLLIQSPQNAGTLTPVGPLRVDAGVVNGFEIVGPSTAFAALSVAGGPSALYNINLSTGAASLVGTIALANATDRVTGLSAPPSATNPAANSTVFAIVNGTSLISFPRNAPSSATAAQTITGMQANEMIVGADYRPADGQLYALTRQQRVYTINTTTAAATLVAGSLTPATATDPFTGLNGTNFGVDFSPLADAIRVVSDTGQNLAISVQAATAGATTTATNLNFPQPDIVAVGYTSNYAGAPSTRAVVLDSSTSSVFVVNPTINGTILPMGRLDPNVLFTKTASLDIVGGQDGLALAAVQPTDGTNPQVQSVLYRVNPITGNGVSIGPIGGTGTQTVRAMAIQLQ
jgi:trimeric autotransporter adhesin